MTSTTINQCILGQLERDGSKIFCYLKQTQSDEYLQISYQKLIQGAGNYLHCYREHGLQQGASIQIILEHGEAMLYAFIGAILGGFVPSYLAPISDKQDPQHYWTQLKNQSQHIGGGLLVTSPEFGQHMLSTVDGIQVLRTSEVNSNRTVPYFEPGSADDIALLQHSSGTTGSRKGVALTHAAILHQLRNYAAALRLTERDVIVSWLPLYHDMGLISSFLMPLIMNVPVVLLSPFEWVNQPRLFLDAIEKFQATLAWLPNFAFHFLARLRLADDPPKLDSIRALINCSEPCKKEAFDTFVAHFSALGVDRSKLQICYAMAEMVFAATQTELGLTVRPLKIVRQSLEAGVLEPTTDSMSGPSASPPSTEATDLYVMPVGRPIGEVDITIIDERGMPVGDGKVGEIVLAAPFLFSGYYKNPTLTEQAFAPSGFMTGDLGAKLNGEIYITGRKKDLIIVNGRNYYAHDIEAIVSTVPAIKPGRCVAFGVYNQALGSEGIYVIAETESDDHSSCSDSEQRRQLATSVKAAIQQKMGVVIAKAVTVPPQWLLKTTSGKISRKDNKEKYLTAQRELTGA